MPADCSIDTNAKITAIENSFKKFGTGPINIKNSKGQTDVARYNTYNGELKGIENSVKELENYMKECKSDRSITTEMGVLQQEIIELQKHVAEKEQDVETAKARHDTIDGSLKKVSDYQGFSARLGFLKPIHETSVSILIGLGIFLIIASIYVGYTMFGQAGAVAGAPLNTSYSGFLGNFDKKAFLLGVGAVVIVVAVLSWLGLYGRSAL
jgi:hypothetical protein